MREPLSQIELNEALQTLAGWEHTNDKLKKTFTFKNFQQAIGFIVRLSFHAEKLDHHPELYNVYNKVILELTTHDAGNKVTSSDVKLATMIERI